MVERIAGYEIIGEVGAGAMATVYRARAVTPDGHGAVEAGADVAIKVLRREYLTDLGFRARFEREGEMIAGLEHAAIVPVYSFGQYEEQLYIVMAYLRHGSLAERLLQGTLPPDTVLDILARVAVALDYAHSQGVVHRDLKPSNVLFDDRDRAYLADFGIAWQAQWQGADGGTISGTPAYMSPEQARRERGVGAASDRYALGVLAFQLLTGVLPFHAGTPLAILVQHVTEPPPAAHEVNGALPASVTPVLQKALSKDAAKRYESAAAFVAALRRALADEPGAVAAVSGEDERATARAVVAGSAAALREAPGEVDGAAMAPPDGPAWRERLQAMGGNALQGAARRREALAQWLVQRPAQSFALATALGIACALIAVYALRGPQLAAAPLVDDSGGAVAAGTPEAGAIVSGTGMAEGEVFLPLAWWEPGRVTPTATAVPPPPADVQMLYDSGMITLLNIGGGHVTLGDVTLRRVRGEEVVSPSLGVDYLRRVAGSAVEALPAGDCLQLISSEAVRNRRAGKPAQCDTLRGWLATRETNQLFDGIQEGDAFEVLRGEQRLALCALGDGGCEFRVAGE